MSSSVRDFVLKTTLEVKKKKGKVPLFFIKLLLYILFISCLHVVLQILLQYQKEWWNQIPKSSIYLISEVI